MRVRGLKRASRLSKRLPSKSHPMRVRGLKRVKSAAWLNNQVAPHAGAWIETQTCGIQAWKAQVAPHAGAWMFAWHVC